jgi:hypothetical protein
MTGWWVGIPAAETTVECAGDTHRIRWQAGELRAVDHDDADGERALAALGGQRCACIDLLDAWHRHAGDTRVLALAGRGPRDVLSAGALGRSISNLPASGSAPTAWVSSTQVSWISQLPRGAAGPPPPPPVMARPGPARGVAARPGPTRGAVAGTTDQSRDDRELIGLLGLGGGFPDRLQASVIGASVDQLGEPGETSRRIRRQLHAALYGRAASALQGWLGRDELDVELQVVDGAGAARLERTGPDQLRAELPLRWLEAVWSRGLASVIGRFCLDATTADDVDWTLSTVGPDLGPVETITIRLPQPPTGGR